MRKTAPIEALSKQQEKTDRMRYWIILIAVALLSACSPKPPAIEEIKATGELRVLTRNSPTTYYFNADGEPDGLEHELIDRFAEYLGVKPVFIQAETFDEIIPRVALGEVHMAAAGLTISESRQQKVRFSHPYQHITEQIVYRIGTGGKPDGVAELSRGIVEVVAGTTHVETLEKFRTAYPGLRWQENKELDSEQILYLVWEKVVDFTLADSNLVDITRRYYPELRIAFDMGDPQPLAWALPPGKDDSLLKEVNNFLTALEKDGTLRRLIDRYYGHTNKFDFVDIRDFRRHYEKRLPLYQEHFEHAAEMYDLDWQLLAALSYQESHWNPKAVSPTGVRGMMMLTRATAKQLGVKKRTDPKESIYGGAKYLDNLHGRLPERIQEPDRTWMAMAAYNVGMGHLRDARKLTQKLGDNPDHWLDVKKHLPKLSQAKYYKDLRYGYARGHEPVRYVEAIRSYLDLLHWQIEQEQKLLGEFPEPAAGPPSTPALNIDSPVL